MRKILLLTLDFPPSQGGVARYLHGLAYYFQKHLFVLASNGKDTQIFDQKAPYSIERKRLLYKIIWPHWLKSVLELLKRSKMYEIVFISHVLPLGTSAWIASWITHKPYIIFLHGFDLALAKQNSRKFWLLKKILSRAHFVVCNSNVLSSEVKQVFDISKTLTIYPPYLFTDQVEPEKKQANQTDQIIFLTVSRLVKRKGHIRVLYALASLRDKGYKNFVYWIVGDGSMRREIEEMIEELDLCYHVQIFSDISDSKLHDFYAQADIFIMPTIYDPIDREGFGMVYIEAAAYGIPSIATKQPGVDEAVIHEQTGILVEDGNQSKLCEAIEVLSKNKVKREQFGKQARERVFKEFTTQKQFSKLEDYL